MQWLKLSHFSRGALAAFALLGASPTILEEYSPLDMVAVVHAVIMGWNQVAAGIASTLHHFLDLPEFPSEIVTSVMLALAIAPAWSFSILKSEWGQHEGVVQNTAFGVRGLIALTEPFLFSLFVVAAPIASPIFWLSLLGLALPFGTTLARLPTYRRGFLFALGALAAMEGVYLLSTERVQSAFDSFVCQHQTVNAPRCKPTAE